MSKLDSKIGPKIKAFRRQLGMQANKLAEELNKKNSKGGTSATWRSPTHEPEVRSTRKLAASVADG